MELECPNCGARIPLGKKFCGQCGQVLATPPAVQKEEKTVAPAERKLVTVLFADAANFTTDWVEKKVQRHLMRARNRKGFGRNRWSRERLYKNLGLYNHYEARYYRPESAAGR